MLTAQECLRLLPKQRVFVLTGALIKILSIFNDIVHNRVIASPHLLTRLFLLLRWPIRQSSRTRIRIAAHRWRLPPTPSFWSVGLCHFLITTDPWQWARNIAHAESAVAKRYGKSLPSLDYCIQLWREGRGRRDVEQRTFAHSHVHKHPLTHIQAQTERERERERKRYIYIYRDFIWIVISLCDSTLIIIGSPRSMRTIYNRSKSRGSQRKPTYHPRIWPCSSRRNPKAHLPPTSSGLPFFFLVIYLLKHQMFIPLIHILSLFYLISWFYMFAFSNPFRPLHALLE